jgi:hypothetical protein
MTYDSVRKQLVLFGGGLLSGGETWVRSAR